MKLTTVSNVSVFRNDSSIALVIHLADGQSYRVNTTDDTQLRIGMEGIKCAFPSLIKLSDQAAARTVLKGEVNGMPVAYELVNSKKLDAKGIPYQNVRLAPALVNADDADLDILLGFTSNDGL